MVVEVWKDIPGKPGYRVSDQGRVIGPRGKILKPSVLSNGYLQVHVRGEELVHRLVLFAFVGPCPPGMQTLHDNNIKSDNRLSNLSWGTPKQNARDLVASGGHHHAKKTHCDRGHEFTPENTYIHEQGRFCRTCDRENANRYRRDKGIPEKAKRGPYKRRTNDK